MNLIAEALRYGPQLLPCKVAFHLANIHQTAAPRLVVATICLQLTTHLSTPKG